MSPLRARMIEDMSLGGLAGGTQRIYAQAVYRLTAHYRRAPDQLSEDEVRRHLLGLRERGVARGTFKTSQYGLYMKWAPPTWSATNAVCLAGPYFAARSAAQPRATACP